MNLDLQIHPGKSFPLGATTRDGGVNFSLFTKNAAKVELLLFDAEDHSRPTHSIQLNPRVNKTFYYWHCFIPGLKEGQLYAYRINGPFNPDEGFRFDGNKVLIDPYARAVVTEGYQRSAAEIPGDNCAYAPKSVVIDPDSYDWEEDQPLKHSYEKSIIYELHVGGFTKHPSSGLSDQLRGTYRGLIEKIPYLKSLGITAVELLPVQQFDPQDAPEGLVNYWGYAPMAMFAPHNGYSSTTDPVGMVNEFKDMVKALHQAGIEIILDVVYNHTAEGNENGPTLSFKGIENRAYYMLENDPQYFKNYSGTGNTLNANHSIVRRMIRDSLRTWVAEMHIDGFRFDLASVLSRDEDGATLENPPLLWEIESDPVLASTKIIAEAWDIEQYQLGNFVGDRWAEWNGRFRDDIRRFIKGDQGMVAPAANRIMSSPDLFNTTMDRNPNRSINFVTCHDGFTLNDLVSYNDKHNDANKEDNRDGTNANYSWNCGAEGFTDDPAINSLRSKQIRNFFTMLFISQGTPMLLMGDEVRRSQKGNNNAYCQDNEISWFDWDKVHEERDLLQFVRQMIQFHLNSPYFQEKYFWNEKDDFSSSKVVWHGPKLRQPDLNSHSHTLAFTLVNPRYDHQLHIMINAYWEPINFDVPPLSDKFQEPWRRIFDTSMDINGQIDINTDEYMMAPRSICMLRVSTPKV